MRAALVRTLPTSTLELEEVEEPQPGPAEVLVEIEACGICGTDLHILAGESYRPELPFVLGHEPVGRVVAVGTVELEHWLGRRVTMTLFAGCGTCALCRAGDERLCAALRSVLGVSAAWGGFAERLRVAAAQVIEVPDGLGALEAAALVDAGATAANASRLLGQTPGDSAIAVVGGGPVGYLVAELLRLDGRSPVAVEPLTARRSLLEARGFAAVESTRSLDRPFDVVVDCSGADAVPPWALAALAPRGTLLVVGYATVPELDLAPVARKELALRGVRSGSRSDLERVLALTAAGDLRLPPIQTWPVGRINEAFAALRAGVVDGKAVIDFNSNEGGTSWTG